MSTQKKINFDPLPFQNVTSNRLYAQIQELKQDSKKAEANFHDNVLVNSFLHMTLKVQVTK